MGRSFGIGTACGIAIKAHPSFALVPLWVAYQWGVMAGAGVSGALFGALVILAVFGCVLVHELAHALVAMRYGLRVHDITILPIGGVARVEHAAISPRTEIAIALAGPAANLGIALALLPLVLLVAAARHIDHPLAVLLYASEISVAGFVVYLWIANLMIALFNLLPAFPMDGGRVLRATLSIVRDRVSATRLASFIGQLFALLLAVVGVWLGDYLMPLVSVFIVVAARMESRFVELESSLRALPVGQFALWESGGIGPDAPLAHAVKGGPRDMVVTQRGVVLGMLWRRDILRQLNGNHRDLIVRDLMDTRFNPVEASDSVYEVRQWLIASNRSAVPVVQRGEYRGIFTTDRLAHVQRSLGSRATRRWQRGAARSPRLRMPFHSR